MSFLCHTLAILSHLIRGSEQCVYLQPPSLKHYWTSNLLTLSQISHFYLSNLIISSIFSIEKHKVDLQSETQNLETVEIPTNCTLATYIFINVIMILVKLSASVPILCNENNLIPERSECWSFLWERSTRVGVCLFEAEKLKKEKGGRNYVIKREDNHKVLGTERGSVWHHVNKNWPSKEESANTISNIETTDKVIVWYFI